jgi:hypothetical protein
VKVHCFRPNGTAGNKHGTQPVGRERQPTDVRWYRISGKTANALATESRIAAVEDRRCHAREPDGSNQSTVLASRTAVMPYVVGTLRVFLLNIIYGDAPLLIGKDLQSKAVPQRLHKQPSSEQKLEASVYVCL